MQAPSHNPRDKGRTRSADLQEVANISNAQHSTTNQKPIYGIAIELILQTTRKPFGQKIKQDLSCRPGYEKKKEIPNQNVNVRSSLRDRDQIQPPDQTALTDGFQQVNVTFCAKILHNMSFK